MMPAPAKRNKELTLREKETLNVTIKHRLSLASYKERLNPDFNIRIIPQIPLPKAKNNGSSSSSTNQAKKAPAATTASVAASGLIW